jgi:MFS family permease
VWWLSLAQLITWGSGFYGFALLMGPMEVELGMDRAQSSLAFSLALLGEGVMAFAVGRWVDQGHARRVMTGGSLAVALCFVAHRWVDSVGGFYAVWSCMGLAWAATLYAPAFTVLTQRYGSAYRRAIITMTFLGGLASTVFIPLTAALVEHWGWRDALWVLAALNALVCAPLHAWWLRPSGHGSAHGPNTGVTTVAAQLHGSPSPLPLPLPASTSASALINRSARDEDHAWSVHLKQPAFWWLSVFVVLMMGTTAALPPHLVSLLREAGMSEAWAIAMPASIGVLQVVGRLGLYSAERHLPVNAGNLWLPALIPLGFAVLLWGYGQVGWSLLFVLLFGVGNGLLTIVRATAMTEYVSRLHTGSLNGLLGFPTALARAFAPWLMGLLWSSQWGYTWGLACMCALGLVAVVCMWMAQKSTVLKPH